MQSNDEFKFTSSKKKSNAIDTNYYTTFLQTADVANSYWF